MSQEIDNFFKTEFLLFHFSTATVIVEISSKGKHFRSFLGLFRTIFGLFATFFGLNFESNFGEARLDPEVDVELGGRRFDSLDSEDSVADDDDVGGADASLKNDLLNMVGKVANDGDAARPGCKPSSRDADLKQKLHWPILQTLRLLFNIISFALDYLP